MKTKTQKSGRNKTKTYNFNIKGSNNYGNDFIYYVIFEEDFFPAPTKKVQFRQAGNGSLTQIEYRTWNDKYDSQGLFQRDANQFSKSNSVIYYNLKLK